MPGGLPLSAHARAGASAADSAAHHAGKAHGHPRAWRAGVAELVGVVDADGRAVLLGDFLHDGQPQAGAIDVGAQGPVKGLKHQRALGLGDARAAVLEQQHHHPAEAVGQQATPAVDYFLAEGKKKFYLLGSDYVYPQTTNLVLLEYLLSKGVPLENIGGGFTKDGSGKIISAGKYTPFGHTDYQQIVSEIKQFCASGDACIISTLNGDTNVPFFKEYAAAGLTAETAPVVSFSISEDEFRGLPADKLEGQLGCWTYFQSINSPANKKFITAFQTWLKKSSVPGIVKEGRVTCSPMVLSYVGVYLWKAAVEKAGSFEVDKVREAWKSGVSFAGPGGTVKSQPNMHLTKNVFIGETKADGQFKILKSFDNVYGEPWLKGKFKAKGAE